MRKSPEFVALYIRKDSITAVIAEDDRRPVPLSTIQSTWQGGDKTGGEALRVGGSVATLLRGGSLWLRGLSSNARPGTRVRGGDAFSDPASRRPDQDGPSRRALPGETEPERRADLRVGAR